MKKLLMAAVVLSLLAPLGASADNDAAPNLNTNPASLVSPITPFSMGDVNWLLDVTTPTGDIRCLGVEFDGANYWVTGAFDMTIAYLYEISPTGVVINSFLQPAVHWGGWGWRDLAYDNGILWAGDPNSGFIQEIDMTTGVPTGTV